MTMGSVATMVSVLVILAGSALVRWPGLTQGRFASHDVGGILYNGMLLRSGGLPYVDSVEWKAPGSFYVAALVAGADIAVLQLVANLVALGSLALVMAFDARFHEHMGRVFPHEPDARSWFEGSPEADAAREAGAKMNAAMQAAYWTVGLRAAGLACGPMSGFDTAGVDAAFFPDGRFRSFLVMNVGTPAAEGAWFGRSPRFDYGDVVQTV